MRFNGIRHTASALSCLDVQSFQVMIQFVLVLIFGSVSLVVYCSSIFGMIGSECRQDFRRFIVRSKLLTSFATRKPSHLELLEGAYSGRLLNVAMVDSPAPNSVPRGENSGRKLSHVNVVRTFRTQPITHSTGSVSLDVPAGVDASVARVIAYVQDPRTLAVVGATAVN